MPEMGLESIGMVNEKLLQAQKFEFKCLSEDKKPSLLHHRANFKDMNDLMRLANNSVRMLRGVKEQDLTEYKKFYEEINIFSNLTDILIANIEEQLENFRKFKPVLQKDIDELINLLNEKKRNLLKHPIDNRKEIKEIAKTIVSIKKSKKSLSVFNDTKASLKNEAKNIANIMTTSTWLHCLLNFKEEGNYETYNGAVGILFNVKQTIDNLLENDEWKHLRSRSKIKYCKNLLSGKFLDKLGKYFDGLRLFHDMRRRRNLDGDVSSKMKNLEIFDQSCKDFEKEVSNIASVRFQKFESMKPNRIFMKTWAEETQKKMEELKQEFVSRFKGGNLEKLASLFADICLSTQFMMKRGELKRYVQKKFFSEATMLGSALFILAGSVIAAFTAMSFPALSIVILLVTTSIGMAFYGAGASGLIINEKLIENKVQIAKDINDARNQQSPVQA